MSNSLHISNKKKEIYALNTNSLKDAKFHEHNTLSNKLKMMIDIDNGFRTQRKDHWIRVLRKFTQKTAFL